MRLKSIADVVPMNLTAHYEAVFGAKIIRTVTLLNGGTSVSLDLESTRKTKTVPDTPTGVTQARVSFSHAAVWIISFCRRPCNEKW
jgi:hypothetical protein